MKDTLNFSHTKQRETTRLPAVWRDDLYGEVMELPHQMNDEQSLGKRYGL